MKYVFIFILLIHGLIHLMGFVKAFAFAEIDQLSQHISKPMGLLWLLTFILFIVTTVAFITKKEWWFVVAIITMIISQILIIIYWKDAKFGSIANLIILLISTSAFGNYRFHKMVQKETKELLAHAAISNNAIINHKDILHLPKIVQRWLQNSGVISKERITSVRLKQKGTMRTKPESKWMPFEAIQYFNVENPSFIWTANVKAMAIINMVGRDRFANGEGEMFIKLASLIPVVDEGGNHKINSGTMLRFLSEMCWFPSGALNDYISWKAIDKTSAKAIFTYNNQSVSGVFLFTEEGNLVSFEALRYYGGGKDATLEKWFVETITYKEFNGITIPDKSKVTWKLKEGNFHWFNVEIINIDYNFTELFKD